MSETTDKTSFMNGRGLVLLVGLFLLALVCAGVAWFMISRQDAPKRVSAVAPPSYVGAGVCRQCHATQFNLWKGSDHELAMQHAAEAAVLGDFKDQKFTYAGVTSTFFRRDGKFFVNTDGPDGKLNDYEIKYTFGVRPLQQYLIEFPDGRIQPLSIAWDTRPAGQGGQRWFHLYPGQHIDHKDPLHWTKVSQNWNYMCAECHTTNLQRNYDVKQNRFDTKWSEINVACESCHGPGSNHLKWAREKPEADSRPANNGLIVNFTPRAVWSLDEKTGNSTRTIPRTDHAELETCGLCHSRRAQLKEGAMPGQALADTHEVSLLDRGLYHADGQMQDEVFNYGSFAQSKMFAKGVSCGDCHEPHSLKLRAPGNGVCLQCHAAPKYDAPSHHHHKANSAGTECASCHMPTHTYMGVDERHDHSFRIPRPDQSKLLGAPDACTDCHRNKTPAWAAGAIENWFGPNRKGFQSFGPALHAARADLPEAPSLLGQVIADQTHPAIARATAYAELAAFLTPALVPELAAGLDDPDTLVRMGALQGLGNLPAEPRWRVLARLLNDPVLAVRVRAAALLAGTPTSLLTPTEQSALQRGIDEYIATLHTNLDRPEAHVALGLLHAQRGDVVAAEKEYMEALKLDPSSEQGAINLADLYRELGRDAEGEKVLRRALAVDPKSAGAHHALGLLLARKQQIDEAIRELGATVDLAPDQSRYVYVYAIALSSSGQVAKALQVLETNHARHPADRDTLAALVSLNRNAGRGGRALEYARKLQVMMPDDPDTKRMIEALERGQ